jgi:hypothetical protein
MNFAPNGFRRFSNIWSAVGTGIQVKNAWSRSVYRSPLWWSQDNQPDLYLIIDGNDRIAEPPQLGRDTVEAVVWLMAEGLLLDRSPSLFEHETALEQGWLLAKMERFGLGDGRDCAPGLNRSIGPPCRIQRFLLLPPGKAHSPFAMSVARCNSASQPSRIAEAENGAPNRIVRLGIIASTYKAMAEALRDAISLEKQAVRQNGRQLSGSSDA